MEHFGSMRSWDPLPVLAACVLRRRKPQGNFSMKDDAARVHGSGTDRRCDLGRIDDGTAAEVAENAVIHFWVQIQ